MIDSDWLACDDYRAMLRVISQRADLRRIRLLACACSRSCWQWIRDRRLRRAIIVAERYARGEATVAELRRAGHAAWQGACKSPSDRWTEADLKYRSAIWDVVGESVTSDEVLQDNGIEFQFSACRFLHRINDPTGEFSPSDLIRQMFAGPPAEPASALIHTTE